jgi:membrane-associated phospholipid phosphatase
MVFLSTLDHWITGWLNQGVGHWLAFDNAVRVLTDWNFFRAAWLGCFLVWAWHTYRDEDRRLRLIAGLAGVFVATGLSKLLQVVFFVHSRPFTVADQLGYHIPASLFVRWGDGNCFPSDTASAYFAVAALVLSLSRGWGYAAFAWVTLVIALPRVYLLYHWPSDLVAGALLGTGVVALFQHERVVRVFAGVSTFEKRHAAVFYPVMFVVIYEIVDSFHALEFGLHQMKALVQV